MPDLVFSATPDHPCAVPANTSRRATIGSLWQCPECNHVHRLDRDRQWRRDHNPGVRIAAVPIANDSGIVALIRSGESQPYGYIDRRGNWVDSTGTPDVSPAFAMLGDPGLPEKRDTTAPRHAGKPRDEDSSKWVAIGIILLVLIVEAVTLGLLAVTGNLGG